MSLSSAVPNVIEQMSLADYLLQERYWFQQPRTPIEFLERIRCVDAAIDSEFLFNRNDAKWVREALILAAYGRFMRPTWQRLSSETRPDAIISEFGLEIPIEISMVIEDGRQLGTEYRGGSVPSDGKLSDWLAKTETIESMLARRIAAKALKPYSSDTRLLVYLNMNEWGVRQTEVQSAILAVLRQSTNQFSYIDVLWKDRMLRSSGDVHVLPGTWV